MAKYIKINSFLIFIIILLITPFAHGRTKIPSKYHRLDKVKLTRVLNSYRSMDASSRKSFFEKIEYLDCSWHQLDKTDFLHLLQLMPNIKVLDLSHNEIKRIALKNWKYLANIKRLDISYNRLQAMEDIPFKKWLTKVEELDVSHNEIMFGMLPNNESIISADLSHNLIKEVSIPTHKLEYTLKYLDVSGNRFTPRKSHTKVLVNLKYLDISNNDINKISLEQLAFPLLDFLNVSNNPFKEFPYELAHKIQLKELDLSHTNLESLEPIQSLKRLTVGGGNHAGWSQKFKTLIDSLPSLSELTIVDEPKYVIQQVLTYPNLKSLKRLNLESCGYHSIPDISVLPNLKYLGLYNNDIYALPHKDELEGLKNLKSLDISLDVEQYPTKYAGRLVLDASELVSLHNNLPNTKITYYNPFINSNAIINKGLPFYKSDANNKEKVVGLFSAFKQFENEDEKASEIIVLEAIVQLENEIDPCSEKRLLVLLQSANLVEKMVTSESKDLGGFYMKYSQKAREGISKEGTENLNSSKTELLLEGKSLVKYVFEAKGNYGSIIMSKYEEIHKSLGICHFKNEEGVKKVKAKMYESLMNIVEGLRAEYDSRNDRIQRLIGGVGTAGTVSAIGTGVAAGTFNENLAGTGEIVSFLSDNAADAKEEKIKYLKKQNEDLEKEIVKLKEMANTYLR